MNRSYKTFICCVCLLASISMLSGCSDWLDLKPENDLTEEEFWQNQNQASAALAGVYTSMRANVRYYYAWGEMRGGFMDPGVSTADNDEGKWRKAMTKIIEQKDYNPANLAFYWGGLYRTIKNVNNLIAHMPQVLANDASFSELEANTYLAEAKFVRALMYFYLVRTFHKVPLVTDPYISDDSDFFVPQSPTSEVMKLIYEDLKFAERYCRDGFEEVEFSKGRATKGAVRALLADVYLWEDRYDDCLQAIQRLEESGAYGLIAKEEWRTNFYPGNTNESIFEIQFDAEMDQAGSLSRDIGQSAIFRFSEQYMLLTNEIEEADVRGDYGTFIKDDEILTPLKYFAGEIKKSSNGPAIIVIPDPNYIIYRYADILLLKAEALAESNKLAEAWRALNRVRTRAGAVPFPVLDNNKDEFYSRYMDERTFELAFEGKRWFDLLRLAKRNDFEKKDLVINILVQGLKASEQQLMRNRLANTLGFYLPIKESEIRNNPSLEQNPYYGNRQ